MDAYLKIFLAAAAIWISCCLPASAQFSGTIQPGHVLGNPTGVEAPAIDTAPGQLGFLVNNTTTQSVGGTIATTACGTTLLLTGAAFYNAALGAANTYPAHCGITVQNDDVLRFKYITASGYSGPDGLVGFYLGPRQAMTMISDGTNWHVSQPGMWQAPGMEIDLYTNYASGSDTFGATDGMSAAQPFKSAQAAYQFAQRNFCFNSMVQTSVVINMAAGVNDAQGLHLPVHDFCGAQGGFAITFKGASQAVTGAVNNGSGLIRLTVPSTSMYITGSAVSVYGVGGTTEANASWKVTVVNATTLDLQNSAFTHIFTSAGTITTGSGFQTTNLDAVGAYFSTVTVFTNITFSTISGGNCLFPQIKSHVYLSNGNIFLQCVAAQILVATGASVEIDAAIGLGGSAYQFQAANNGVIYTSGAQNCDLIGNLLVTIAAWAFSGGNIETCTYVSHGYTVSGQRWQVDSNGILATPGGNANVDIPGSTNGVTTSGGIENGHALQPSAGGTGSTTLKIPILGTTTNDNAAAGVVGEYVSSTIVAGSAVPTTSATAITITSIVLSAGDWDVWIDSSVTGAATTTMSSTQASISFTNNALLGTLGNIAGQFFNSIAIFGTLGQVDQIVGPARVSLASPTTVYFVQRNVFGTSTCSGFGIIQARRVR